MTHPSQRLDEVIHQRVRLGILTVLSEAAYADFGYLKETLGLTDGNLSRHLSVLEDAGYVKITKGYQGKRPHTAVSATKSGRKALANHVASMRELFGQVDRASTKGNET